MNTFISESDYEEIKKNISKKEIVYGIINILDVVNWEKKRYCSVQEIYEATITEEKIPDNPLYIGKEIPYGERFTIKEIPEKKLTEIEKSALGFLVSVINGDSLPEEQSKTAIQFFKKEINFWKKLNQACQDIRLDEIK